MGKALVDRLGKLSGHRARPNYRDGACPFELVTTVSRKVNEARLVSTPSAPEDVRVLWDEFNELRLFEDHQYGQWGLRILNEAEAGSATKELAKTRPKDFVAGDLVVGEFLGDGDLLILRSDPDEADFGSVLIALPLDSRLEWCKPAGSLVDFINRYVDAEAEKFWEQEG